MKSPWDEHSLKSLPISIINPLIDRGCSVEVLSLDWQTLPILEKYHSETTNREKQIAHFFSKINAKKKREEVLAEFIKFLLRKDDFTLFKHCIKTLSEKGANVMVDSPVYDHDKYVENPIPLASYLIVNHIDQKYLSYLMQYTPDFQDNVLTRIEQGGRKCFSICPLTWGVYKGSASFVNMLLDTPRYRRFQKQLNTMTWPREGTYPIHIATKRGNIEILELLIKKGANVNQVDKNGNAPIHMAVKQKNPKILELLLDNGANINHLNRRGNAPIHLVFERYSAKEQTLALLVKREADVNLCDREGKTPLDYLGRVGMTIDPELCETLVSKTEKFSQETVDNLVYSYPNLSSLILSKYQNPLIFSNFDVYFHSKKPEKSITIPGNKFHINASEPDELDKKAKESGANVLEAQIILVASDMTHKKGGKHRRKMVTVPVTHWNSTQVLHIRDFYKEKQKHPPRYQGLLEDVLNTMPPSEHQKIKAMHKCKTHKFHTTFHCTERALYKFLMKEEQLQNLIAKVERQCFRRKSLKFYAVIIDIHSTKYLCCPCEQSIPLMYGPKSEFVKQLGGMIKKQGHHLPSKGLRTLVRFSAKGPGKNKKTLKYNDHLYQTLCLKRYSNPENMVVMQATSSELVNDDTKTSKFTSRKALTK